MAGINHRGHKSGDSKTYDAFGHYVIDCVKNTFAWLFVATWAMDTKSDDYDAMAMTFTWYCLVCGYWEHVTGLIYGLNEDQFK